MVFWKGMLTRAWFVLSVLWLLCFLLNFASRRVPGMSGFDWSVALFPLVAGFAIKLIARYVVIGL